MTTLPTAKQNFASQLFLELAPGCHLWIPRQRHPGGGHRVPVHRHWAQDVHEMGGPEGRARRLGRQRVHTYARANDDQQMPEVVRSFYCQLCANASLRGCVNPASWIPLAVAVVPRNLLATNMHSTVHSMPANRFVLPAAPLADPHYGIPGFLVLFPFWGFTSLKSSVLFVRNSRS